MLPIARLIESKAMDIVDCNNYVKTASAFFGGGCAVNILADQHNPLGDNTQKLCSACGSDLPGQHCTSQDRYAGYQGAVHCLMDKGDVAFVKHNTVPHVISQYSDTLAYTENDFELLCLDGSRAKITDYLSCNWGKVPGDAIVTSSAKTNENRVLLQEFLKVSC